MNYLSVPGASPEQINSKLGGENIISGSQILFNEDTSFGTGESDGFADQEAHPHLRVDRIVIMNPIIASASDSSTDKIDLGILTSSTAEELRDELKITEGLLKNATQKLADAANDAAKHVLDRHLLKAAIRYQEWTPPEFQNEWIEQSDNLVESLSAPPAGVRFWARENAVYKAQVQIVHTPASEALEFMGVKLGEPVQEKWMCNTLVWLRSFEWQQQEEVMAFERKEIVCASMEEAERRANANMERLTKKYFAEDWPCVPDSLPTFQGLPTHFCYARMLLPRYRLKGEELPHCFKQTTYEDAPACIVRASNACKTCPYRRKKKEKT